MTHKPSPGPKPAPPTPVRASLPDVPAEIVEFPGRVVLWNGDPWWAQELGRTALGRSGDGQAILTVVGFLPGEEPGGTFQREALVAAAGISALTDEELVNALASAVPFAEPQREPKPFFGPRGRSESRRGPAPRSSGGSGGRRSREGQGRRGSRGRPSPPPEAPRRPRSPRPPPHVGGGRSETKDDGSPD